MATYIKTEPGGNVSYEIEPVDKTTMLPNSNADASQAAQAAQEAARAAQEAAASVAESAEQISQNTEDISDLKDALTDMDGKIAASLITATASGAIASLPDGADNVPVEDLTVQIEPVQDLHGQANPYPAGGGKNKLNATEKTLSAPGYLIGSASEGSPISLPAGEYTLSFVFSGTQSTSNYIRVKLLNGTTELINTTTPQNVTSYTFTLASEANGIVLFAYNATGGTWKNFQIESGSTASTFAPYANICPISGWTGANVVKTGKNLLRLDESEMVSRGRNRYFPLKLKAGTYNMSCQNKMTIGGANNSARVIICDSSFGLIGYVSTTYTYGSTIMSATFTISAEESSKMAYLGIEPNASGLTFAEFSSMLNMIEPGSNATAYEPYKGNTYSVDWTDEAGTVYGGTLDVTTGVLTVDRAMVDLGTLGWTHRTDVKTGVFSANVLDKAFGTAVSMVCSRYVFNGNIGNVQSINKTGIYGHTVANNIYVYDSSYTDAAAFKAAMSGVQLVYELTEPVTYQLSPQEVTTLLGQNNIWSDTGDVEVDYRADTKLYIEKLTAPTEDDMTANTNIPNATYFMVGNTLYLSTTTIPAGDTINPGTNCTLMNLASALNALNS